MCIYVTYETSVPVLQPTYIAKIMDSAKYRIMPSPKNGDLKGYSVYILADMTLKDMNQTFGHVQFPPHCTVIIATEKFSLQYRQYARKNQAHYYWGGQCELSVFIDLCQSSKGRAGLLLDRSETSFMAVDATFKTYGVHLMHLPVFSIKMLRIAKKIRPDFILVSQGWDNWVPSFSVLIRREYPNIPIYVLIEEHRRHSPFQISMKVVDKVLYRPLRPDILKEILNGITS